MTPAVKMAREALQLMAREGAVDSRKMAVRALSALEAEDEAEKCPNGCAHGWIAGFASSMGHTPYFKCPHPSHKPAADTKGGE